MINPVGRRVISYRPLTFMQYRNNKIRSTRAMTLVETLIAMAIMAIIFAALLPQLRLINNSWDSKVGASETLQNGRVLIDHLNRNLSKASRITAVSDSSETNGYIEFIDNDVNNVRYDVNSISDYAQFGLIGSPSDLAGPVSQLQFTCYDSNDFSTPITDVNSIRFVKVQTTVINSADLDQDMTFTTQAYIRTNALPAPMGDIYKLSEPWLEYDIQRGSTPALSQIDATHYLCAYTGMGVDGFAVVLTIDTDTWDVSKEVAFEYDDKNGMGPSLAQIDQTHYLCAYQGEDDDGWVRILKVNTGSWTISEEDSFEFDADFGKFPALVQIDQTHYLCAYAGVGNDGWVVVFSITAPLFDAITMETPFEFDTMLGVAPALLKIDSTHYLCAYEGPGDDGWAVVLTVNTDNWSVSKEMPFEFDPIQAWWPALSQIDTTHYLCAYEDINDDGIAVVLTVDTSTWAIAKETTFEYAPVQGINPALSKIDDTHYLCAWRGGGDQGSSIVLTVDTGNLTITKETEFVFDTVWGIQPALSKIDDSHYLCAYAGLGNDGYAGVLEVSEEILP
ncbi:MAG: type II secretion system protein [Planctomycetes bacterium]|nr:type II secretion system protein [Planctomycetota bacterium]